MGQEETPVYKKTLLHWAFKGNLNLQLFLLLIIVVTVFARVLPLEMQKRIVNEAIKLGKMELLILYCGIYLAAVVAGNGLKYAINILQTLIGERALANMRRELFQHILELPLPFFRKTQPGTVVSFLLTELSTAGTFAGMAFAVPITNVLTLLAFAGYLFWLNPLLAVISLSIYPVVLLLIPLLQSKTNFHNKRRVEASRKLSDKIAESVTGIQEIQANGAFHIENEKYARLVSYLRKIRIVWQLYRYGIKVVNNFFTSIGPLLIFILGGYLIMNGRLELGALVAFLSAQEKLYDPWKELIEYYQVYQDARIRYDRTMSYFEGVPPHALLPVDRPPHRLNGAVSVQDLTYFTEDGICLLDRVSFSLEPGQHMALIGFSGSGKSMLVQCISQLLDYTDGSIRLDNHEVAMLTKNDIACNIGIISQSPFIFNGTLQENLTYAVAAVDDTGGKRLPDLDQMISVLQQTGLFVDVLNLGLRSMLDPETYSDMASQLVHMRAQFQDEFGDMLGGDVEFFNENEYLLYSSVAENIVFGSPRDVGFNLDRLEENTYFTDFLDTSGLTGPLLGLGISLARQTIDILGNLPPENVFFEQSPLSPDELEAYRGILARLKNASGGQKAMELVDPADKRRLLTLGLRFCPGKHKMVALPKALQNRILSARARFREAAGEERPGAVAFYRMDEYMFSQSILNNILFGKTKSDSQRVQERVSQSIVHLLIEEGVLEQILEIGMQFQVGNKGENLSGGQRQKLAVARAILKSPKILIMDEATAALDNKSQARIQNFVERRLHGDNTVIAVVHRLDIIKNYDMIGVMKSGRMVEIGTYDQLMEQRGILYELVHGRK